MIKVENRFDEYAYRVATYPVDVGVTALEEGQWVTLTAGKIVISTGATSKSFLCISSKRTGRDSITGVPVKKASFLVGPFVLSVSNYATGSGETYGDLTPLVVTAAGALTPYTVITVNSGTHAVEGDAAQKIVAYSLGAPAGGYLRICSV